MKITREQLINQLNSQGLIFCHFSLATEGNYTVWDADWNYKDVPHLRHMHHLIEATPTLINDDTLASIILQKIMGIRIPLTVLAYQVRPRSQMYYMAWMFFIVIVETEYEEIGPCRTRVTTHYSIGSPPVLKWLWPFIRWALKRNFNVLMAADIPMRERKGQLRAWGYSYYTDTRDYSFKETLEIASSNVLVPKQLSFETARISVHTLAEGEQRFIGRDDHLGLRIIRSRDEVLVFQRMCSHEGASLDQQKCINGKIQCAWHGRQFGPLASFNVNRDSDQVASTDNHEIRFKGGELTIQTRRPSAEFSVHHENKR